jgi:proteic killer suppression protein
MLESNDEREIRPDQVRRVRNVLAALISARIMAHVAGPPGWRIHQLSGDRALTWSISVSGNWRITFVVDSDDIWDLDQENHH